MLKNSFYENSTPTCKPIVYIFLNRNDRYDSLRICIGDEMVKKLSNLKIFMVGCGAIGCEMMKNYAMLGIGSSDNGKVKH